MSIPLSRRIFLAGAMSAGIGGTALAQSADGYPSRTIQLIVPYPPGGAVD
jgi:tripartite-type tricarboxylate transporter receptor subunit TctC